MPRGRRSADEDAAPVMVPRNDKTMVAVSPERVQRLREHLTKELVDLRNAKHPDRLASPQRPGPTGFPATVARSACCLCKGWCCRNGDDDAFLDDRTLARVRLAKPEITEQALLRLYADRVPAMAYRDSCIFHGKLGCTLDRSMRSDVCNTYYCGGLDAFIKSDAAPAPTVVIAGEGDGMRTSAVLVPKDDRVEPVRPVL
jgi:hypothetical protein